MEQRERKKLVLCRFFKKSSFVPVLFSSKQKKKAYFTASIHLAIMWELLFICSAVSKSASPVLLITESRLHARNPVFHFLQLIYDGVMLSFIHKCWGEPSKGCVEYGKEDVKFLGRI